MVNNSETGHFVSSVSSLWRGANSTFDDIFERIWYFVWSIIFATAFKMYSDFQHEELVILKVHPLVDEQTWADMKCTHAMPDCIGCSYSWGTTNYLYKYL